MLFHYILQKYLVYPLIHFEFDTTNTSNYHIKKYLFQILVDHSSSIFLKLYGINNLLPTNETDLF